MIHTLSTALPLVIFLVRSFHTSTAWTTITTSKVVQGLPSVLTSKSWILTSATTSSSSTMFATDNGNNEDIPSPTTTTKRKRKRKKKKQFVDMASTTDVITQKDDEKDEKKDTPSEKIISSSSSSSSPVLELKPREDAPVQLEMKNIRELVSGGDSTTSISTTGRNIDSEFNAVSSVTSMLSSIIGTSDNDYNNRMKDRPSSSETKSFPNNEMGDGITRPLDDSLDQLLKDAMELEEEDEEDKDSNSSGGAFSDEKGTGVRSVISNALSAIVTVDFFVVLGFLAWFLLGIFCSSILKDDTVQILFNNNFEKLVQPALGILAIASIGGSFFSKEEEEL